MKKLVFQTLLALYIIIQYSCLHTVFSGGCPNNRIIGDVYLMTKPHDFIPEKNSLTYCSSSDTMVFVSEGLIEIDSVMELTAYCEKEDFIEGYIKAWNCARTKVYIKYFYNSKRNLSIEYSLALLSYWGRTEDEPWTANKSEEDTILYDQLLITYKGNYSSSMQIATSLRSNPAAPYIFDSEKLFDSLYFDPYLFNDVYTVNWADKDTTCFQPYEPNYSDYPCFMFLKKKKGIIAMKLYKGWYFLKEEKTYPPM